MFRLSIRLLNHLTLKKNCRDKSFILMCLTSQICLGIKKSPADRGG